MGGPDMAPQTPWAFGAPCQAVAPLSCAGWHRVRCDLGVTPRPWSVPVRRRPGRPYPLGATWDGAGVNFALFSENSTAVELCIFDGDRETRVPVTERTEGVWHVYLPEARPGLRYGYRV